MSRTLWTLVAVAAAAAAALAVCAAPAAARSTPLNIVRIGHGSPRHQKLYGSHHSFMSPFFRSFVHNQKRSFSFPGGRDCEHDAHRLCGGVLRRCVGRFDCAMQCLVDHGSHLSEKCRAALPCTEDAAKMCKGEPEGKNELFKCLEAHKKDVSAACKRHHVCLRLPHFKCRKENYNMPPVDFIGTNVMHFLEKVRSGAFTRHQAGSPFGQSHHGFFHPGGFAAHRNQHMHRRFNWHRHHPGRGAGSGAVQREENMVRQEAARLATEERELLGERRELAQERRDLEQERRHFEHDRRNDGGVPAHHPAALRAAAQQDAGYGPWMLAGVAALAAVGGAAAWKFWPK